MPCPNGRNRWYHCDKQTKSETGVSMLAVSAAVFRAKDVGNAARRLQNYFKESACLTEQLSTASHSIAGESLVERSARLAEHCLQ